MMMKSCLFWVVVSVALLGVADMACAANNSDRCFKQLDANGNQKLSAKELTKIPQVLPKRLFQASGADNTPEQLKKKLDADGSGGVSRAEWNRAKARWQHEK